MSRQGFVFRISWVTTFTACPLTSKEAAEAQTSRKLPRHIAGRTQGMAITKRESIHKFFFVFWSCNDIADPGTYNLLGIRVEGKSGVPARPENPTILAGALLLMLQTADRIIDDAVKALARWYDRDLVHRRRSQVLAVPRGQLQS
eukprot:900377-Pyramimonas_sp.AAC.1